METLTIKALKELCEIEIAAGNGDKIILISSDDEGNGYHKLLWGLETDTQKVQQFADNCLFPSEIDIGNTALLGQSLK